MQQRREHTQGSYHPRLPQLPRHREQPPISERLEGNALTTNKLQTIATPILVGAIFSNILAISTIASSLKRGL